MMSRVEGPDQSGYAGLQDPGEGLDIICAHSLMLGEKYRKNCQEPLTGVHISSSY